MMSPELRAMLQAWLESGDETQRRHAAARLAMQDGAVTAVPAVRVVPLTDAIRAVRLGFRACLYSDSTGCGCSGTRCHHLGRLITLHDCIVCLGSREDGMKL